MARGDYGVDSDARGADRLFTRLPSMRTPLKGGRPLYPAAFLRSVVLAGERRISTTLAQREKHTTSRSLSARCWQGRADAVTDSNWRGSLSFFEPLLDASS